MTETPRAEETKSVCFTRWPSARLCCVIMCDTFRAAYLLYLVPALSFWSCFLFGIWGNSRLFFIFIPARDEASLELLTCTTQEPGTKILYITIVAVCRVVSLFAGYRSSLSRLATGCWQKVALHCGLPSPPPSLLTDMGIFAYPASRFFDTAEMGRVRWLSDLYLVGPLVIAAWLFVLYLRRSCCC